MTCRVQLRCGSAYRSDGRGTSSTLATWRPGVATPECGHISCYPAYSPLRLMGQSTQFHSEGFTLEDVGYFFR